MNIQIFGTKKCNDTKKAERFFKERGIKYQFVDMKEKGMSKGEFNSVAQVEYSCAMKSHFRKFGNQMSGSGNHLCKFTPALIYPSHKPHAWSWVSMCPAQSSTWKTSSTIILKYFEIRSINSADGVLSPRSIRPMVLVQYPVASASSSW